MHWPLNTLIYKSVRRRAGQQEEGSVGGEGDEGAALGGGRGGASNKKVVWAVRALRAGG